jgi:hypothetical protein
MGMDFEQVILGVFWTMCVYSTINKQTTYFRSCLFVFLLLLHPLPRLRLRLRLRFCPLFSGTRMPPRQSAVDVVYWVCV